MNLVADDFWFVLCPLALSSANVVAILNSIIVWLGLKVEMNAKIKKITIANQFKFL